VKSVLVFLISVLMLADTFAQSTVSIRRYERELFSISIDSLQSGMLAMQPEYSSFYNSSDLQDSANLLAMRQYLQDSTIQTLYADVMKQYATLDWLEADLGNVFSRIKSNIPEWKEPAVYTYISGGDVEFPVKYSDSVLIIALDLFLGKDYGMYQLWGLPTYLTDRMTREFLLIRTVMTIGESLTETYERSGNTLLARMIYEGKILYFCEMMLPQRTDSTLIGYTTSEITWAEKNYREVWKYFKKEKLLQSDKRQDIHQYVDEGPGGSTFIANTVPRVGCYIGWQIVRAYMKKQSKKSISDLLKESDSQMILRRSRLF